MLVLCSNGLSSEELLQAVGEKTKSCKTAALVVTADNEYKGNNRHVSRNITELESLKLSVDIFDLDASPAEKLLDYDVVEFIGGNPFYLLHSIRKHKAEEVLRTLTATKILIGWSAAVFVFGPTLELVNEYSSDMNFLGLIDLTGLRLAEVEVLPHYSRFIDRFENFEEKCRGYEKEHCVDVLRLNDGEGVLIEGDMVNVCRQASLV